MLKHPDWRQSNVFRLEKVGDDRDGVVYTIKVEGQNKYLMTKNSEAGTDVTISEPGANVAPTKWILHKHGELYQIIHKENGANAITWGRVPGGSGLVLARNQGGKGFSFDIKVVK